MATRRVPGAARNHGAPLRELSNVSRDLAGVVGLLTCVHDFASVEPTLGEDMRCRSLQIHSAFAGNGGKKGRSSFLWKK